MRCGGAPAAWCGHARTATGFTARRRRRAFASTRSLPRIGPIPAGALDDVEVARAAGLDVAIVEGDEDNLKLTWPGDFARAEAILKGRAMDIRLGNGYDVHAFCDLGDHVWLCGVKMPHSRGLLGHSDADVGMHALTDAIYGALARGRHRPAFPALGPAMEGRGQPYLPVPCDRGWRGAWAFQIWRIAT
jgi:hypothetical protein